MLWSCELHGIGVPLAVNSELPRTAEAVELGERLDCAGETREVKASLWAFGRCSDDALGY
jgi:hypothetical protein